MRPVSREFLDTLEKRGIDECMRIALASADEQTDRKGLVYGDVEHSDEEVVMFYKDLQERGVFPHLEIVNADLARKYQERFHRLAPKLLLGDV
jgi:hypothetical protein